ncbi:MAG: helix-turn-helix domain-containing protein [Bacillota bacterium]
MSHHEKASFFERLKNGLEDSVAYSRGQLSLKTTQLPAPPPPASPRRVRALRKRLRMSQSVFAATLNVSPKLVQSWEQGLRTPDRGELRLLEIIERNPDTVSHLFAGEPT